MSPEAVDHESGRVLGIDLGTKRIGIAVSNADRTMAFPLTVVERSGDRERDHARIASIADEEETTLAVVGLPVALSGREETAAQQVRNEVQLLASVIGRPLQLMDERMTSATANKALAETGQSSKTRRNTVDKHAAAAILQTWLDSEHPG